MTGGSPGVILASMLLPLLLATACRPDKDPSADDSKGHVESTDDSIASDDSDSPTQDLGFDLIYTAAEDQIVRRVRLPEGFELQDPANLEVVWDWHVRSAWPELSHKPHGLDLDGDRLIVAMLDYFSDAGVVELDVHTGALIHTLRAPQGTVWGGEPTPNNLRFTHNTVRDGDTYISSDTHNQRVLATDADWNMLWEINRETSPDALLRSRFSQPNDVERVQIQGEERLLVSTRGDFCNFVLLYAPDEPLRPHDPPWRLVFRYPPEADAMALLENHNPRPMEDGSGFTVADSGHDRILGVSWEGELLWSLPDSSCESSILDWPRDAVYTPKGTLLVGDTLHDRIVELDPNIPCPTESDILWQWSGINEPYQLMILPHAEGWGSP